MFLVKSFVEWSINTDQEVDVLVEWQGHDEEDERTWEALEQLDADLATADQAVREIQQLAVALPNKARQLQTALANSRVHRADLFLVEKGRRAS